MRFAHTEISKKQAPQQPYSGPPKEYELSEYFQEMKKPYINDTEALNIIEKVQN